MFENPSSLPAAPLPTPGKPEPKPSMPSASAAPAGRPPANLPAAPVEDMFSKTEPVKTAPMPSMGSPKSDMASAVQPPMVTNRKTIVVASLVLGIVILIGGGIALARFLGKPILGMMNPLGSNNEAPAETATGTDRPLLTESPFANLNNPDAQAPAASDNAVVPPADTTAPKDTDSDGLNDDEEAILGTDIAVSDTDKDGLSDYDEVRVYRTDPANADTDGDTYRDGDEVKNGYNPAGAGKIFGTPPAAGTSTTPAQ